MSIASFIFAVFNIVLRGIIINFFWDWFIIPQFTNAPDISMVGAIGLSFCFDLISSWNRLSEHELQEDNETKVHRELNNSFYYFASLFISFVLGFITHLFM